VSSLRQVDRTGVRLPRRRLAGAGGSRRDDLRWLVVVILPTAAVLGWLVNVSLRAAVSFVLIVLVVGVHAHDRRLGICTLFAFWFLAPELRRIFDLFSGYAGSDPLSLAPFLATGLLGGIEFYRSKLPLRVRRLILLAAAGFTVGLPLGVLHPQSGVYAFAAYLSGVTAMVLGFNESPSLRSSTLRRVLIFGVPLVALYAIVLQRILPLPHWEQAWLDSVDFNSIGADSTGHVRVFSTLNAPGTLAPLLGLALLAYLTVHPRTSRARNLALASALVLAVALDLTFVRSSWLALPLAALAHVIASRGRSARIVFGIAAFVVAGTLVLSPVSPIARDVVNRASTFGNLSSDVSLTNRSATLGASLPSAVQAPLGHGLGTAGQPSQLNTLQSDLAVPDNGYLSLLYQVGPIGFLLVMAAIVSMVRAAWRGARAPGPDQEMGLLIFAMLVFMLVVLLSGDAFYGLGGLTLWFIGGQALALGQRRQASTAVPDRRQEGAFLPDPGLPRAP
jgi:O-Antigen ligase